MTFYHGSDNEFATLRAESYITPERWLAETFGSKLYEVEATPDEDEITLIGGRRYISGTVTGTCTAVYTHSDEGWLYATTRIELPANRVS